MIQCINGESEQKKSVSNAIHEEVFLRGNLILVERPPKKYNTAFPNRVGRIFFHFLVERSSTVPGLLSGLNVF